MPCEPKSCKREKNSKGGWRWNRMGTFATACCVVLLGGGAGFVLADGPEPRRSSVVVGWSFSLNLFGCQGELIPTPPGVARRRTCVVAPSPPYPTYMLWSSNGVVVCREAFLEECSLEGSWQVKPFILLCAVPDSSSERRYLPHLTQ